MAWNGSGTYSRPVTTVSPATGGTTIDVADQNTYTADVTAGVNACLAKNGENAATGNLDIGGYRIENIDNGVSPDDCAALGQVSSLIAEVAEGTFSNNANGNPNVSDTSFNFTALTINNYETIGPTAAGSTNTWTALDSVPTGVDWIEVAVNCSVTGTATLVSAEALARASGGSSSSSATQFIARTSLGDGTSNAKTSATTSRGVKIPVDSAVEFEGKYTSTAGTPSIILYLTGYGTNP